jgi:hypothetical protein
VPVFKLLLALALGLGSLVCAVIILIEAFRDEIWKGILALLCGLYLLWFAIFDFDHDHKWLIVGGYLLGGAGASLLVR